MTKLVTATILGILSLILIVFTTWVTLGIGLAGVGMILTESANRDEEREIREITNVEQTPSDA